MPRPRACADGAVRRLVAEFAGVHSAATVTAVVDEAVGHLDGQVSPAALPELLERLARQRLDAGTSRPDGYRTGRTGRRPAGSHRSCSGAESRRTAER